MKDEFYIGWQEESSSTCQKTKRLFLIVSLLVTLAFVGVYITFTGRQYLDNFFDYGNLTTFEGQIIKYPVWGIRTQVDGEVTTVPLVGFGKHAIGHYFDEYTQEELNHSTWQVRGTLSTYQDKHWMELTEGPEAILGMTLGNYMNRQIVELGEMTLQGEIVDPKCFFGVMNPGVKKIHRSCAIRCISGNIPPVMAIRENGKFVDYYFVLNEEGKLMNANFTKIVGMPILLKGQTQEIDDWKAIKVAPDAMEMAVKIGNVAPFCNNSELTITRH